MTKTSYKSVHLIIYFSKLWPFHAFLYIFDSLITTSTSIFENGPTYFTLYSFTSFFLWFRGFWNYFLWYFKIFSSNFIKKYQKPLRTIHLRCPHFLGEERSKIGQSCRRIVVKKTGEGGVKNHKNLPTSWMNGPLFLIHFSNLHTLILLLLVKTQLRTY